MQGVHRCWRWDVHRFQDLYRLWLRCQIHSYSVLQLVTLLADTVASGTLLHSQPPSFDGRTAFAF